MIKRWCPIVIVAWLLSAAPDARADLGDKWHPATMTMQGVGGLGAMIGVGALVTYLTTNKNCEGWGCLDFSPVIFGALAGLAADVAATQLIGDAFDGTGTLGGTMLGTGVGLAGGILSAIVLVKIRGDDAGAVSGLAAICIPIAAGSVLGYHISADEPTMNVPLIGGSF